MLRSINIRNFRGINSCHLSDLGKVNVFVGKNNSGKSTILEALCIVKSCLGNNLFDESVLRLLLYRRGIERSVYTVREFWHKYDTEKDIIVSLELENEKLSFKISWFNDIALKIELEKTGREPFLRVPNIGNTSYERLSWKPN